jgi:hypothetical protein
MSITPHLTNFLTRLDFWKGVNFPCLWAFSTVKFPNSQNRLPVIVPSELIFFAQGKVLFLKAVFGGRYGDLEYMPDCRSQNG